MGILESYIVRPGDMERCPGTFHKGGRGRKACKETCPWWEEHIINPWEEGILHSWKEGIAITRIEPLNGRHPKGKKCTTCKKGNGMMLVTDAKLSDQEIAYRVKKANGEIKRRRLLDRFIRESLRCQTS